MKNDLFELLQEEPDEERAAELVKNYFAERAKHYKRTVIPYADRKWSPEKERQYIEFTEKQKQMNVPMEGHKKIFYIADLDDNDDMEKIWSLIDADSSYRKTHLFTENLLERLLMVDDMPLLHAVIRMEQGEPGSCIFENREIDLIAFAVELEDRKTLRRLFPYIKDFDRYDKKHILELIAESPEHSQP